MKRYLIILLGVLLCAGAFTPMTTAKAAGIFIDIGDHGYYTRGPYYWDNGRRWNWVSGHWEWHHHHKVWIHGHYR